MASKTRRSSLQDWEWEVVSTSFSVESLSSSDNDFSDLDDGNNNHNDDNDYNLSQVQQPTGLLSTTSSSSSALPIRSKDGRPTSSGTAGAFSDNDNDNGDNNNGLAQLRQPTGLLSSSSALPIRPKDGRPTSSSTTISTTSLSSVADNSGTSTPRHHLFVLNCELNLLTARLEMVVSRTQLFDAYTLPAHLPAMAALQRTCRALQEQLQGLSPIVKKYVEHWTTYDRDPSVEPPDAPINGDLGGWMSELRDGLLVVQSHIDGFANAPPDCPPTPTQVFYSFNETSGSRIRAFNDTLASCDAELDGLRDTMAEFLPIIKCDYGEFRTQHMNLVSNPEPMTYCNPADPTVAILRDALYNVRDEIQNIVDILVTMHTVDDSPPIPSDVPAMISRLNKLREAPMLILTNNASEWIESDLSDQRRILTYTAFVALSPETLRDGAEALAEVRRELDVDGANGRPIADVSREMVYRHQLAVLMYGGQMEELQSVADGLEYLLLSGS